MSWILVAMVAVTPIEALSTDNRFILWSLPFRGALLLANLWALRTGRLGPVGSGQLFLAQGVVTVTGWSLLLGSSGAELAFQCIAYGAILSIWTLLVVPREQRTWWSMAVVGIILVPVAVKLLPQDALLFVQSVTILAVHSLALATLDVHANRVEAESKMASIDPLTGLFNRRPTLIRLTDQVAAASAGDATATALVLDLDRFKNLNDTLGHEAGDDALRRVAAILTSLVRPGDLVCRWGGEEFLVLLPRIDEAAALQTAERLRARVAERGVTVSIGVAEVHPSDSVTTWVARADAAMYAAKQQGRNRVVAAARRDVHPDAVPVEATAPHLGLAG